MKAGTKAFCLAALVLAACLLPVGCRRGGRRPVSVVGSTSIHPFADMLSQEFNRLRPEANVEVHGGGSTAGVLAVEEGIAQIGMCSRALKADEARRLRAITVALDGMAIVVHRSNPVVGLSRGHIREVFAGRIDNWKHLGGPDRVIRLITREEGSGTREAFVKLVMQADQKPASGPSDPRALRIARSALTQESNGAVKELVRHDPCAIGYMSLGLVGEDLKVLEVDGVYPTTESVASGAYPLVRPFLFVVKGDVEPRAQAFIDFVLSADGQRMLEDEGLIGIR